MTIRSVTPWRPGLTYRYIHSLFQDIHHKKKNKTNEDVIISLDTYPVVPLCINVNTHTIFVQSSADCEKQDKIENGETAFLSNKRDGLTDGRKIQTAGKVKLSVYEKLNKKELVI